MRRRIEDGKTEAQKNCLQCGEPITYGRSDRKFCCFTCRSRYNYEKDGRLRAYKHTVIRTIDHNYAVLDQMLKQKITSIEITDLILKGFRLGYITSCVRIQHHNEFRCYDLKFILTETRLVRLERIDIEAVCVGRSPTASPAAPSSATRAKVGGEEKCGWKVLGADDSD